MNDTRIAICVATFRRTRLLARLLASLDELAVPRGVSVELRVVDNDAAGSAHSLVAFFRAQQRTFDTVHYGIEAEPNIANARNATLDFGPADRIMFIDGDEVADSACLQALCDVMDRTGADAVVGQVNASLPPSAPGWLHRGFLDHPAGAEDASLDWLHTRCGCTLVRGAWFYDIGLRFRSAFCRSGGEDVAAGGGDEVS